MFEPIIKKKKLNILDFKVSLQVYLPYIKITKFNKTLKQYSYYNCTDLAVITN